MNEKKPFYSDYYKDRNKKIYEYKDEVKHKRTQQNEQGEKEQKENEVVKEIEEEIKNVDLTPFNEVEKVIVKKSNKKDILKILIILIPVIIFLYIGYINFIAEKEFNYFYDIGSSEDLKNPHLSPVERITELNNTEDSRNITNGLVYFNVPIPPGSEKIRIQTKFKDDFPEKTSFSIGAKDRKDWHYKYKAILIKELSNITDFYSLDNVYVINEELYPADIEEIREIENIVIATNLNYTPTIKETPFNKNETTISNSLRGAHTFYIYTEGDLSIKVKKQDINWYNGSDEMNITLFDSDKKIIITKTIPDDGITDVDKTAEILQEEEINIENLPEELYILEFSNFDGLIREIKINSDKIVSSRLFLADNSIYSINTNPAKIYTKVNRPQDIEFLTYHTAGFQNITISNISNSSNNKNKKNSFRIDNLNSNSFNLTEGEYELSFPENDLIISSPLYFAFNKSNYFEPYTQRVISIRNDMNWLRKNVDYIITDYVPPQKQEDGWIIAENEFDIKEDNLYVNDNTLSFVFNSPHFSDEKYYNNTIPIDWINVTVYKSGLIKESNL